MAINEFTVEVIYLTIGRCEEEAVTMTRLERGGLTQSRRETARRPVTTNCFDTWCKSAAIRDASAGEDRGERHILRGID